MMIDIIFIFILISAAIKGARNGIIGALFSFAAFFIALAAALKLSALVAEYLQNSFDKPAAWWPFVAFLLVFLVVSGLITMAAKVLNKTLDMVMLGWVNKIGGFLIYAILYTLIFSVVIFYYDQIMHISDTTKEESKVYAYIEPWGEWTMQTLGRVIPVFKDVFTDMQDFFQEVGEDIRKSEH
ncbi:MAG TPA: CvpA family protein [Chitinophagaceae bacterium]|nr:CvpA family protein [Chitinophagaceae bacterium]